MDIMRGCVEEGVELGDCAGKLSTILRILKG
jgi:hypothetical protein